MSMFRTTKRPRRWLAEIVTRDGLLLRRLRFSSETVAEAVRVWREIIAPYSRDPLAARIEFYATTGEPDAPPVEVIPIYNC